MNVNAIATLNAGETLHDLALRIGIERREPAADDMQERQHQHAAGQLEKEIADRDAARLRRRVACVDEHGEQAAAEIGAEHQPERNWPRISLPRTQGSDQQHDRQTRVAQQR